MQPERAAAFAPPNKLTKQRAVKSLAQGAATTKNWEGVEANDKDTSEAQHAVTPNPSVKLSDNGVPYWPSSGGPAAHFALAVLRVTPSSPAYLKC